MGMDSYKQVVCIKNISPYCRCEKCKALLAKASVSVKVGE